MRPSGIIGKNKGRALADAPLPGSGEPESRIV